MAKIKQNALMHGVSGRIGKAALLRVMPNGDTILGDLPKRRAKATPKELVERNKFREAAMIAKIRAKDPILGPQYLAKAKPGQGAYHVALAEELNKDKPQTPKRIKRKSQPLTQELSIEIANLSMLAVNRIIMNQQAATFVQNILKNTEKTTKPSITPPKRHQEIPNQRNPHIAIDITLSPAGGGVGGGSS